MSYLIDAVSNDDIDSVKSLLKSGYDPNIVIPFQNFDSTALICAARRGNIDIIKELLKAGADHNKRNKYDSVPLVTAAFYNNIDCVKELLKLKNNKIEEYYIEAISYSYKNGRLDLNIILKEHLVNELIFLPLSNDIIRNIIMKY